MGPEHNPADDQPADREEYERWERQQQLAQRLREAPQVPASPISQQVLVNPQMARDLEKWPEYPARPLSSTADVSASNREMDLFELGDSQYDDDPPVP